MLKKLGSKTEPETDPEFSEIVAGPGSKSFRIRNVLLYTAAWKGYHVGKYDKSIHFLKMCSVRKELVSSKYKGVEEPDDDSSTMV